MGSGIIQARLGPNFLSGQMSIQRNYKVGLVHFHRLRLARSYIDGENKASFLIIRAHWNHIGHTRGGGFGYHCRPHGASGPNNGRTPA